MNRRWQDALLGAARGLRQDSLRGRIWNSGVFSPDQDDEDDIAESYSSSSSLSSSGSIKGTHLVLDMILILNTASQKNAAEDQRASATGASRGWSLLSSAPAPVRPHGPCHPSSAQTPGTIAYTTRSWSQMLSTLYPHVLGHRVIFSLLVLALPLVLFKVPRRRNRGYCHYRLLLSPLLQQQPRYHCLPLRPNICLPNYRDSKTAFLRLVLTVLLSFHLPLLFPIQTKK